MIAVAVEAVESEGGSRTIPDQPLEAGAVGGLDANAGVQTEPTAVIPGEHVFNALKGFSACRMVRKEPSTARGLRVRGTNHTQRWCVQSRCLLDSGGSGPEMSR